MLMQPPRNQPPVDKLNLALTFPEAKPVLLALCREDRAMIKRFYETKSKVRSWLALNKGFLWGTRDIDLLELIFSHLKYHVIKKRKTFNDILEAEDRLKINQQILSLMDKKNQPKEVEWQTQIAKSKEYLISNLIEFNRSGFTKCIWHNEKTASLKYYPLNNTVYCFSCQKANDSIGVVRQLQGLSFKEAVLWLQSRM